MTEVLPIKGLDFTIISGREVKALSVTLQPSVDVMRPMALRARPGPWVDEPLPFALGDARQAVNPFAWARNCAYLADLRRGGSSDTRITAALDLLRAKLAEFSDGNLFRYRYAHTFARTLKPTSGPWSSALGNAFIVLGAAELFAATRSQEWADLATRYAQPLMLKSADTDLVTVDAVSWLWFQETPPVSRIGSDKLERTGVLNGHVGTVFALYHLLQVLGPSTALDRHIRAGAATAATYYQRTRRPGAVMDYWIFDQTGDYGPRRAGNFAATLYEITEHPMFDYLRDCFRTDVAVRP